MVQLLCLFFPPFLSIAVLQKHYHKKLDLQSFLITYSLYALMVNFLAFLVLIVFFGQAGATFDNNQFTILFSVKYILLASFLAAILPVLMQYVSLSFSIEQFSRPARTLNKRQTVWRAIKYTLAILMLTAGILILYSTEWIIQNFGEVSPDEVLFQLKVPLQGTNPDFVISFLQYSVTPTLAWVAAFLLLLVYPKQHQIRMHIGIHKRKADFRILPLRYYKKWFLLFTAIVFIVSLLSSSSRLNLTEYISGMVTDSSFIEDHYVDPETAALRFPEEKRNLIYIFMESMETTYYSKELGGAQTENLLPELSELALEHINFSNSDNFGGAQQLPNTGWTIAAMTAQHSGVPLKIPVSDSSYGDYASFLPGIYSLGDVLAREGYNQMLMVGSEADYGGRATYYSDHGNYEIYDLYTSWAEGYVEQDSRIWWGFQDKTLYSYAKDKITNLAKQDKPFNFTMLTADTHHPDGLVCDLCENRYEDQYSNVIACASRQVAEFVSWIQEQDFYENTTIVICGDHLSMDSDFFQNLSENYTRTTLNIIINSAAETDRTKNRSFSTVDLYPTTLASLGVAIEGNRLGLGTNLFSDRPTLIEEYGLQTVTQGFINKSRFYNEALLYP